MTYDGTTRRSYVNGVLDNQAAMSTLSAGTNPLRIASRADDIYRLGATLDEVAVYGTCLSGKRIMAHYLAGCGALVR